MFLAEGLSGKEGERSDGPSAEFVIHAQMQIAKQKERETKIEKGEKERVRMYRLVSVEVNSYVL